MDSRLREQLVERMTSFDGDTSVLGRLIADLDAIWFREVWSESDRRRFRESWGTLEQIYAGALDDDRALDDDEKAEIRVNLGRMVAMLPEAQDRVVD
jgi:hypothetical protein